jgi:hypothetical protein
MAKKNNEQIGQGLEILRRALAPYIKSQLKTVYKERWWSQGTDPHVGRLPELKAKLAKATDDDARFESLDIAALLTVLNNSWNEVFQADLGHAGRSYANELRDVRNKWAHQDPITLDDAYRAFDTMTRLLEMVAAPERAETGALAREIRSELDAEDKKSQLSFTPTASGALSTLKPWREVASPHPDVSAGRYQQAEFAADLSQVITGRATSEYLNPKEFFNRTYFTDGLSQLLARAWQRLAGTGGDPVVELQTNFGGGKTHSLLALYHLFGGQVEIGDLTELEKVTALIKPAPTELPIARRAVLTCISLAVDEPWKKPDGTEIRTLWGEMAWQLGGKEGFALVAEADRQSVSPGSEKLTRLFEQFGPALILIDEWVVYARKIIGKDHLPSGTFDVNISFVQELTEAAKAAGNSLVVAAIPASDAEVGGENGVLALERIRNVFGRLETVWKPASSQEAFEIVRRRLFEPLSNKAMTERDAVCRAFAELYRENRGDFPPECRETAYEQRLKSAYPIHPEVFDRLYQDWSTLERFQLTRGVLRLMASVIYELWVRGETPLLIMPGNLPLDSQSVRSEFTRHLPDGWAAVLDKDIDGPTSRPFALDRDNRNLGIYSASRRVARTLFIGSAPTSNTQRIRGLEVVRVKLGCTQPGETISAFGDALNRLSEELHYLYSDANRYWFDTQITITRQAADRAAQFERKPEAVEDEIIHRMRALVKTERHEFDGVHPMPADSADVPNEASCRLVILAPKYAYRPRGEESKALSMAKEILEKRGSSPRLYRNMLIFLAPDADRLAELEGATRMWLSWQSIEQDKEQLNLNTAQINQARKQVQNQDERVKALLLETFCHLIVPAQEGTNPVVLTVTKVSGENLLARAVRKLKSEGQMITDWAPALLRMELDRWLWKDVEHISVRQVWEYMAQYIYLPRLLNQEVLTVTIRNGVSSFSRADNFAYASGYNPDDKRYVGLVVGQIPSVSFGGDSLLVKPEAAKRQREAEAAKAEPELRPESVPGASINEPAAFIPALDSKPATILPTRFHASVELDSTRIGRDAGRIADEIVSHLTGIVGAKAKITLEIDVEVPSGIPDDKVRIISENANTLKFKGHGFEEG